jgi:hypothetical protein
MILQNEAKMVVALMEIAAELREIKVLLAGKEPVAIDIGSPVRCSRRLGTDNVATYYRDGRWKILCEHCA